MFHKRLLKEFKDTNQKIILMVVTQWLMLIANVVLMLTTASFIQKIFLGENTKEEYLSNALTLLLVLAVTILLRSIFSQMNSKISFGVSRDVKQRLRQMTYEKLMKLGSGYRETVSTSEAVQISTEGVEQLEIYFGKYMPQFFYSMLAPITLFFIVGSMSWKVAIVLLCCVPLIPVSIIAVQKFAKKMLAKYWGTYTELGDSFLECLQGLTTLKIYQADERYATKMDEESEKFRKVTMRVLIMQLNSISIMDLIAYGGAAIGIILALIEFRAGNIALAQCFFIMMISAEFFLPLRLLGSFFHIAMNGNAAADKIFRLLDAEEPKAGTVKELDGTEITFDAVSFSYQEDKMVLKDISLTAAKGLTAFVGQSGCGKSTMVSLIMGERHQNAGSIQIGAHPIETILPDVLRQNITRIRHDSYIFAGTVRDNLLMGNAHATEKQMQEALGKVHLSDFIQANGGLSMAIEEKGANLSGGQKQRLALARALLHNSEIYIFDEATSNVDAESEDYIMEVVKELSQTKNVILISHRLANVVPADQIFMMQQGVILESGTHEELLAHQSGYYDLYQSQMELEQYGNKRNKDAE